MTKAEITRLLAIIVAFDRRTVGEADVEAWHLVIGDLDIHDCAEAVRTYYSENREWLMPADVRRLALTAQRRREGRARLAALDAQIAAENPGVIVQRDVKALTAGQPIPADDPVRAERRRQLQAAAHARREAVEADTAARAEHQARLEQARRELDEKRQQAS